MSTRQDYSAYGSLFGEYSLIPEIPDNKVIDLCGSPFQVTELVEDLESWRMSDNFPNALNYSQKNSFLQSPVKVFTKPKFLDVL